MKGRVERKGGRDGGNNSKEDTETKRILEETKEISYIQAWTNFKVLTWRVWRD